jgi:hypothetical protein
MYIYVHTYSQYSVIFYFILYLFACLLSSSKANYKVSTSKETKQMTKEAMYTVYTIIIL